MKGFGSSPVSSPSPQKKINNQNTASPASQNSPSSIMHQQQLCPQRRFTWDRLTDICTQCLGVAPKAALFPFFFLPVTRSAQSTVEFNFQTFIHSCFIQIDRSCRIRMDASSISVSFVFFFFSSHASLFPATYPMNYGSQKYHPWSRFNVVRLACLYVVDLTLYLLQDVLRAN